jgi:hypothetical protein
MKASFATPSTGNLAGESRTKQRRSKRDVARRAVTAVRAGSKEKDAGSMPRARLSSRWSCWHPTSW